MRYISVLGFIALLVSACTPTAVPVLTGTLVIEPSPTFTPIPTFTASPVPTTTPYAALGTVALDFTALLCNAEWMNGAIKLTPCPNPSTDLSGGYATVLDPVTEGLPIDTPVLKMIPNANALFLRYPPFKVGASDRFRTTLRCPASMPCDVQFALEYYDANGKYYGDFMAWDFKSGDSPINVDADLASLTGQTVDFVLALRLFHTIENSQQDNGLWIAPHLYRPLR
jgi:hypothetical protein